MGLNTDEPERPPVDRAHDQSKSLAFSPSCSSSQESSRGYSLTFKHKRVKSRQLFAASSGKHPGEEKESSIKSWNPDMKDSSEVIRVLWGGLAEKSAWTAQGSASQGCSPSRPPVPNAGRCNYFIVFVFFYFFDLSLPSLGHPQNIRTW